MFSDAIGIFKPCSLFLAPLLLSPAGRKAVRPRTSPYCVLKTWSPSPLADWMGRAFSEIVSARLSGAPGLQTVSPHGFGYDRLLGVARFRPRASPPTGIRRRRYRIA